MSANTYTILFVDDEPGLSAPLRLSLEARGYACVSRTNMTGGWRFLEKNAVQVLVTDIMMPAGDAFPGVDSSSAGFYFVRKVREAFPDVAIICLSVIADLQKIEDLKKRNILYLRKGETPLDTARKLIESKATGKISF
jgi:two-component system, NtrC family, response regulator